MLKPNSLRLISSKSQLNSELSSLKVPPKISSLNDLSELNLWQVARGAIALSRLCIATEKFWSVRSGIRIS
jgi:hypothetical protein